MKKISLKTSASVFLIALTGALAAPSLNAQTTSNFDGGTAGTSGFWSMAPNWQGDSLPTSAPDSNLVFATPNGSGSLPNMSVSLSRVAGLITFDGQPNRMPSVLEINTNSSAGSAARSLTLHTGITLQNTTSTVLFAGQYGMLSVIMGANNTFTTSVGSTLQFSSAVAVSGAYRLTKEGAGTLTFEGSNTFTGGLTINQGTVRIQAGAGVGALPGSVVADQVILNGGTLEYYGGGVTSGTNRGFSLGSNGGTISVTGSGTYTILALFSNVAGQVGTLRKTGAGTLSLTPDLASTYSGGTTVASGTLQFSRSNALGSGLVTIGETGGGSATLDNFYAGWVISNNITTAANSGGTLTFAYTSSGTGNGNAIYTGTFTLNDHLTIRSEAGTGVALQINGAISGSSNITKTGAGVLRLDNNNAGYSGTTTIQTGTLQLGGNTATGALGTGNIINNSALLILRSTALALTNQISGPGTLTQSGSGITTLSNANTYTGGTVANGGGLVVTNTSGSATGTGNVSMSVMLGGTGIIAPTGTNGVLLGGQVAPGVAGLHNGVGTLSFTPVDGNVTFQTGSTVAFELGTNDASDKIVFNASGSGVMDFAAMSSGGLIVTFAPGYTPALNDSFDLLDWSNVLGSGTNGITGLRTSLLDLSNVSLSGSLFWDTTLFTTTGVISVVGVPEPSRALLAALGMTCLGLRRNRSRRS